MTLDDGFIYLLHLNLLFEIVSWAIHLDFVWLNQMISKFVHKNGLPV